jgi:hypothetical protein
VNGVANLVQTLRTSRKHWHSVFRTDGFSRTNTECVLPSKEPPWREVASRASPRPPYLTPEEAPRSAEAGGSRLTRGPTYRGKRAGVPSGNMRR